MKIETSKGKTYEVDWIDGPTITSGTVLLQMDDSRPLPEIAADFDGLTRVERYSDTQGDKSFEGYSKLKSISRGREQKILVELMKG